MLQQESNTGSVKDFTIRNYQRDIINVCIAKNSIIFLPTGAGKTYISIQVIKHLSKNQLDKKYSEGGKRSIFLVNTVILAKQQKEAISFHVPFEVGAVTGEDNVDAFNENDWLDILNKNEILVMTAQCFHDAVNRSFIKLQQINVIVFDECHHGRKDHVYHQIMQSISTKLNDQERKALRIIGISAMLIGVNNNIKMDTVAYEMSRLESTFQSTIITVNNLNDHENVLIHSTNAKESQIKFQLSANMSKSLFEVIYMLEELQEQLLSFKLDNLIYIHAKKLRETIPKRIKDLANLLKDFVYQAQQMGNFGAYLSLASILIELELNKRTADSERYRLINKICISKVEECMKKMEIELNLSEKKNVNIILNNSSQKVQKLILLLQNYFGTNNNDKDYQCIIFVSRRSTAKILYHIIKILVNCMNDFPLRPDFVVGYNNEMSESIESVLNNSLNNNALDKFNKKETNCIICTNVLEEGIDIQACNLVLMFDLPQTLRSYVQSKGRARDKNSDYIIMIDENSVIKFKKKLLNWRLVYTEMKKQLIGKTLDRPLPSDKQIQMEQQQAWAPFITSCGSELNALNSISILNQYCMTLPFDRYTVYRESYRRIDYTDGTCQVVIQMPLSSMIEDEIFGQRMNNIRLAKQHAAFEACKLLISNGSLNDKLIPINTDEKIEEFNDKYFTHWKKYANDDKKKAGTNNNLRKHEIKIPDALCDCNPSIDKNNYLYRINIEPKFDAGDDFGLQVFKKLIENKNTYGILTTKRIPKLCKIPLFQSFGKVDCKISSTPIQMFIESESKIDELRRFHLNIFRDILKVFKDFLVIDKSSYLVVPLDEENNINWNLIRQFKEILKPSLMKRGEIQEMIFNPEDYMHKVLNPVYRCSDQNYIVVDVLTNKSPMSLFPDKDITFAEYYRQRNHQIYRNDQFLVEVKGISKNLNLFFPGSGVYGENKKSQRNLREEYIPELCHNYKFPGDYWLKATFLPSICHRLQYLLHAEELRKWLINEKIDLGEGEQIYELDIDYGDYEKRLKKMDESKFSDLKELPNFDQILHEQSEIKNKLNMSNERSFKILENQALPIDLDRNLLNITESDLDYYHYFFFIGNKDSCSDPLNFKQKSKPSSTLRFIPQFNDIKLIDLTNKFSSVQQKDLLKVLTTAKSGDIFDMERYETLGDAFLKFIASLFLYKTHDKLHEGHLTALKGKMVSNRNLFYIGNEFGISKMIKSSQFCLDDCGLPPSSMISSKIKENIAKDSSLLNRLVDLSLSNDEILEGCIDSSKIHMFLEDSRQNMFNFEDNDAKSESVRKEMFSYMNECFIGDKVIADSVEALIGCVISSTGPHSALKLCQKLKIIPECKSQSLMTEKIPLRIPCKSLVQETIINVNLLEDILGYKFENKLYLQQALTHSSYPIKDAGTYENLEFLGDAVLDFLITSFISEQCPKMSPGKLTDLRSALVNNVTLASIVVQKKINKFLKAESRVLFETIKKFVDFQEMMNNKITGEVILMNDEEDLSTVGALNVPKVLGDVFESIIGAVYLDSNLSFKVTWKVIYNLMKNEIHEFMSNVPINIIRRLYEYKKGSAQPQFYASRKLENTDQIAVPLEFKVRGKSKVVIGIGKNWKIAKNVAAKLALIELEKD